MVRLGGVGIVQFRGGFGGMRTNTQMEISRSFLCLRYRGIKGAYTLWYFPEWMAKCLIQFYYWLGVEPDLNVFKTSDKSK